MHKRIVTVLAVLLPATPVIAWDERGHVIVTRLAVGGLPDDVPAWIHEPAVVQRLTYLANEPDRWRGLNAPALGHWNKPDHYLDVESLAPFGMSLKTLPRFRYEFVGRLAAERALHPDRFPSITPPNPPFGKGGAAGGDADHVQLTPGMLPYRMIELYAEAASGWSTLRTLEADPQRAGPDMIAAARERIIQSMGILSHYVGDAAQPLHTTEHHHGWTGANPNGYTTKPAFHAQIDGGVLMHHGITSASMWERRRSAVMIPSEHVWEAILDHIDRSHRLVEPLYKLDKSGDLNATPGREFIEARLADGGAMLAGLWTAAYHGSVHDHYLAEWLKHPERRDSPPSATQAAERLTATRPSASSQQE